MREASRRRTNAPGPADRKGIDVEQPMSTTAAKIIGTLIDGRFEANDARTCRVSQPMLYRGRHYGSMLFEFPDGRHVASYNMRPDGPPNWYALTDDEATEWRARWPVQKVMHRDSDGDWRP